MSKPLVSDEEIDSVWRDVLDHPDNWAVRRLARRLLALQRERTAGAIRMSAADVKQAKANSANPPWTGGYIAGRQDAARIVEESE